MGARVRFWAKPSGKFQVGDAISVIPDTMDFSEDDKACDYSFEVHFPDMSYEKAKQFLEAEIRPAILLEDNADAPDLEDRYTTISKRKWRLKTEDLTLKTAQEGSIYKRDLDPLVENKRGDGYFLKITKETR